MRVEGRGSTRRFAAAHHEEKFKMEPIGIKNRPGFPGLFLIYDVDILQIHAATQIGFTRSEHFGLMGGLWISYQKSMPPLRSGLPDLSILG